METVTCSQIAAQDLCKEIPQRANGLGQLPSATGLVGGSSGITKCSVAVRC